MAEHNPPGIRTHLLRLLLIVLVPLLLIQAGIYRNWYHASHVSELHANLEMSQAVADIFDAYTHDVLRHELAVGTAIAALGPAHAQQITKILQGSQAEYRSLHNLSWVLPNGIVKYSSSSHFCGVDLSDRTYIQRIRQGRSSMVSNLISNGRDSGDITFIVARGIRDSHETLTGIVVATINPSRLNGIQLNRVGKGEFTLIDPAGMVAFDSTGPNLTWEQRGWLMHSQLLNMTRTEKSVQRELYWGVKHQLCMVGMTKIGETGWVAVASRPSAVVLRPVYRTLLLYCSLFFGMAVIAVSLALLMSRHIVAPIRHLYGQTHTFGVGNYNVRCDEFGPREIRNLMHGFNEMAETIQTQQEELTAQNEELQAQQEELTAQNEELQAQQDEITAQTAELQVRNGELNHLTGELERERAFLSASFDILPIAITFIAPDGSILRRNPASKAFAARILFSKPPAAQTLDPHSHLPIPYQEWPHNRALRGEVVSYFEQLFSVPGHPPMPSIVHAAPVWVGNEIVAAVMAFQDITALKEADRAKDEFLAVLSHELQTPLTSILGWSEMALNNQKPDLLQQSMEVVYRNARRQKRLVDDLLDISRIIHGKLALHPEATDLWQLVTQQAENAQQVAKARDITVRLLPPDAALMARVDPVRTGQAIANLLNNALKFTPSGGVITLSARSDGEYASISVQDTGNGIPPGQVADLFNPFHQLRRDEASGGLGLGLALVKGIIELQAGQVVAESPGIGQGSTFTIELPLLKQ